MPYYVSQIIHSKVVSVGMMFTYLKQEGLEGEAQEGPLL